MKSNNYPIHVFAKEGKLPQPEEKTLTGQPWISWGTTTYTHNG